MSTRRHRKDRKDHERFMLSTVGHAMRSQYRFAVHDQNDKWLCDIHNQPYKHYAIVQAKLNGFTQASKAYEIKDK